MKLLEKLSVVVAIIDSRHPVLGFYCYYSDDYKTPKITYDPILIPEDRIIIRLVYTGNFYLSVKSHPKLERGAIRDAFIDPKILLFEYRFNFWEKKFRKPFDDEEAVLEHSEFPSL